MELSGFDRDQVAQALTNVVQSHAGTPKPKKVRKPRLGDTSRDAGGPTIDSEHTSSIHVRQKVYHTVKTQRAAPRELKIDVDWQVIVNDDTEMVWLARGSTWMIETLKTGHYALAVNGDGEIVTITTVVKDPMRGATWMLPFESPAAARAYVHQTILTEKG